MMCDLALARSSSTFAHMESVESAQDSWSVSPLTPVNAQDV